MWNEKASNILSKNPVDITVEIGTASEIHKDEGADLSEYYDVVQEDEENKVDDSIMNKDEGGWYSNSYSIFHKATVSDLVGCSKDVPYKRSSSCDLSASENPLKRVNGTRPLIFMGKEVKGSDISMNKGWKSSEGSVSLVEGGKGQAAKEANTKKENKYYPF